MTKPTNKNIFQEALKVWGPEKQTMMVFEEMSELQKELCKNMRGAQNKAAIAEEIADVEIMLEQMVIFHDCAAEVANAKEYKISRLFGRVQRATCEKTEGWEA